MKIKKDRFRTAALLIVVCALAFMVGRTFFPDEPKRRGNLEDPFYEVFYLYFSGNEAAAKQRLERLMGDRDRARFAMINRGVIAALEKDPETAARYFEHANLRGERMAISYRASLLGADPGSYRAFLAANGEVRESRWADYERAVTAARLDRPDEARDYLERAVGKGFDSTELIEREAAFEVLRSGGMMGGLLEKTRRNREKRTAMANVLAAERDASENGKAEHAHAAIVASNALEREGRLADAERVLVPLIDAKTAFRDRAMAWYRLARLQARRGDRMRSRASLDQFTAMIASAESDDTGFKRIVARFQDDIIRNDPVLR